MTKNTMLRNASATAIVASIAFAAPAFAQGEDSTQAQGSNIVVTASKRTATTVQEVPIAVQALSGADLKAKGALDFADYFHSVAGFRPRMKGQATSATSSAASIRQARARSASISTKSSSLVRTRRTAAAKRQI